MERGSLAELSVVEVVLRAAAEMDGIMEGVARADCPPCEGARP